MDKKYLKNTNSIPISYDLIVQAIDTGINGVVITDNNLPDHPIIYCNAAFENLTGYQRSEIIGHNCRFLQGKDRQQQERKRIREAIEKGESCKVEIRNYKKNGDLFWNDLTISPLKTQDGQITHFIGIQHDISDQRALYDDLERERQKLEQRIEERTEILQNEREFADSILETIRESLLVMNADLKVISVNQHFLRTFKVSKADTENQKLYDLGNGQWDIPQLRILLEQVLPTNNPVLDFEVEHDFPHIGKKIMLLNAHRVELAGSYKNRILLAIEDITERKVIEERKDDFLTIASHELKTPLTAISGYIQIMTRNIPSDAGVQFRSALAKAEQNLSRLNSLIGELLDVSKIQSGNIKLHMEMFDFDKMMVEIVDAMRCTTTSHTITLTGDVSRTVYGDEVNLSQVVSNLISNAIKYSPNAREVGVFVGTVSDYVKVSISDTGIGISPNEQGRIFDRFYRIDQTQKKFPGMGIGLYVCNQIVKNHQGTLWVESENGKGSVFSFTIPLGKK
ncbi:hypothetical protein GCM10023231_00430 [Olivibacter ginsenosidimutans]|uniref:histidine kinase n=1 Tax=Olivibacter ginsenosidimutans TaxID=1176537 RepID=A0ABP9ABM4_9SPHI